jgi:anti-anti-sigma factor
MRVRLQGELDAFSRAALRHLLRQLDLPSTRYLDLNLSAISFCDSSGCLGLLSFYERATDAGFNVRMRSASSQLRGLAELVNPDTVQVFEK